MIKKESIKENGKTIEVYTVEKIYDDETMKTKMNTYVKREDIKMIIKNDADVYTKEGVLLLRFRKDILNTKKIDDFYDNIIDFAKRVTTNRGSATGSKNKNVLTNPKIMTNIFGFFDKWGPSQKMVFKKKGFRPQVAVRECYFNMEYPDKYKMTIPLIEEIDTYYGKLIPDKYKIQKKMADQTHFKIAHTSFTTVTTNVNFQTTIHTDKGDLPEGFGNLAVIERGHYEGGENCFPQYGIGVDVRQGDILFMDVHQPHGNLPIIKKGKEVYRLSIVCYLRKNIWLSTKNRTRKFFESHCKTLRNIRG